jgi:hypothetical protein
MVGEPLGLRLVEEVTLFPSAEGQRADPSFEAKRYKEKPNPTVRAQISLLFPDLLRSTSKKALSPFDPET